MGFSSGLFGQKGETAQDGPFAVARRLMAESRAGNFGAVKKTVLAENEKGIMRPGVKDMLAVGMFEVAAEGHFPIVELLADYGATLDRPHAADGSTALGIAAFRGHDKIVQFLTHRASDVNAKNKQGVTPFMLAAAKCSAETVSKVIDVGGDFYARSKDGLTVRDYAENSQRSEILEFA